MILFLILAIGLALGYVNGANDVSKGIATLVGSGVTQYRRAIAWGTLWTGLGAFAGAFVARAMIQTFGSGLLAVGVHATIAAALATIIGAILWVAIATNRGLPVSTTHAILGSILGASFLAYGMGGVNWSVLGGKVALPLLLSPVAAGGLTALVLHAWRAWATRSEAAHLENDCLCVKIIQPLEAAAGFAYATHSSDVMPMLHLAACAANKNETTGITIKHLHWLTSGATSFARGMNDAPKMAAIVLGVALLSGTASHVAFGYFVAIALGILAGSWMSGQRITEVLACEVTPMNHREGFVANLTTAALVGCGAFLGWPMSTTHVASGAIGGIASTRSEKVNKKMVRTILLAWLVTLPGAALLGAAAFMILHRAGVR
ncbi:MAG TPA: inorganic phosphate transporter [Acidobacteriaceae bacterium]|nr:inorganic phosphate transporter [Acidobacteriaceae bacterium]